MWRTRDRGDLSYWDQLRSVSDEAMGRCDADQASRTKGITLVRGFGANGEQCNEIAERGEDRIAAADKETTTVTGTRKCRN